jgi:Uncharacterised nucleotidyltransferase
LPGWVRERIDRNLADNAERVARTLRAYQEVADALCSAGAEHLVLKGFSQVPYFVPCLRLRVQSDFDLYCPPGSIFRAHDTLLRIGYKTACAPECHTSDHLPLLVPPSRQEWRGNFYDPEIAPAVELHHQFWGRPYTQFGPVNLDLFWARRKVRSVEGIRFNALDPIDGFAHTALHALRHLLYGGLHASNIREVGFFLHHNAANERIWKAWLMQHDDDLRQATAISSFFASRWFGCRLPGAVREEIARLPRIVPRWFEKFADSTLAEPFAFNKNAVWLQLGLMQSREQKIPVLVRRLFPLWIPPLNSRWVQQSRPVRAEKLTFTRKSLTYAKWFGARVMRHLSVLPSTLWCGLRLWAS